MSTAVVRIHNASPPMELERPIRILPIPWRDPYAVSPVDLAEHIGDLELACREYPQSPDLRTCLGMAYAMNYQAYESMDALDAARHLDETHFFAQFKYAELLYRLRALPRAQEETAKAINLAGNTWELSMARKQLLEIRERIREGTQKPEWNRPLKVPVIVLLGLISIFSAITVIFR